MNEATLEQRLKEKGLTAPRITPERVAAVIKDTTYFVHGTLTICVITLANGFTVTGESACASPENFDEKIGEELAFAQARNKIWQLEGYLLKQFMSGRGFDVPATSSPYMRAILELNELTLRIDGAERFIGGEKYKDLDATQRSLLASQLQYMQGYHAALKQRLDNWRD